MISVIVPVYKVEKYLDKCVHSILAQTYQDFEVILVDDGGTDNCPKMCDNYAKNNDKIRVLHKKNGGLSDARNAGLDIARGKYVTFVDSDDFVSDEYLETLITMLEENNADIAVTGIEVFYEGKEPKKKSSGRVYTYTARDALEKMLYQDTLDTSACAMLLPIGMAKNNPFPVGKYHEDEFTTYKYYSDANRISVTTKKQYFYLQRKGSIMHSFGKSSMDELEAADNLVDFCNQYYPEIITAAESKKFSDYCQVLLSNSKLEIENENAYEKIITYLNRKRRQMLFDRKARTKNRIAALCLFGGDKILYFINRIKYKE